jgi:hypothetical protein
MNGCHAGGSCLVWRPGTQDGGGTDKIQLTSVYVDDQEKALRLYTDVLGFVKKTDVSQGPYR